MSLIFSDISYQYPKTTHGIHDLSLSIPSGELVAVIGPSGSGKSTLLKLVAGLVSGHTGQIRLNDVDLMSKRIHERNIGMVFQSYALFPHLSVVDNIAYGLKLRGHDVTARHTRATELLALMGLSEFAQRAIGQLSGGQQQRVALARALAINPSALLLDEPLAALDASIRGQLRDEIRFLQRRFNATTLLVTHDQEEALSMADRVAIMKDGRLLQCGRPREIYDFPNSVDVARFVGLSTIYAGKVSGSNEVDVGFCVFSAETRNLKVGADVWVLIRPENVVLDPPENAKNRFLGRPDVVRYLGSLCRFDFHPSSSTPAPHPILIESRSSTCTSIAIDPRFVQVLPQS
jgi:putative spermidine/putrescine transport system ATP-binding protein